MKLPSMFSLMLPRKHTTQEKARQALASCGIAPDAITWTVGADGSFAFGRKHPDANSLSDEQLHCILEWTRRERIRLGIIGWETDSNGLQ